MVTYCMVILTFSLAIYALIRGKKRFIIPFISSLLGFMLEFFSPGRMSRTDGAMAQSVLGAVVGTLKQTYIYVGEWINLQYVLMMVAAITLSLMFLPKALKERARMNPIWLCGYTLMFVMALFLLPVYAVPSGAIAGRILNIIWMMFVILSAIDFMYLTCWVENKGYIQINPKETDHGVRCIIILVALVISFWNTDSNCFNATRELLNGTAAEFARTNDIRYEMMQNADKGDELECSPLSHSNILFFDDLDTNPDDWKNVAWRDYYGVGMHVVK